jgi:pyridinium-3,5-bisthiocarboxylic acid mononucleotide nickel chelatase
MARDHGHGHDHDHGHGHGHAHGEAHHHARLDREPIGEGAGEGKILFFDAFSGMAGDMVVASLLDLGVPMDVVERAVATIPVQGFHMHRGEAHSSGIVATTFDVHVDAPQPERTFGEIDRMLEDGPLPDAVKKTARKIFKKLGEAEAQVHGMPLADVHFHEVGAVDSIVDIVGASAAIAWLGTEVVVSPLPMGHGFVNARHGVLPVPPPAVVECLRGVPTYGVDVEAELVTPTGAAIAASVAARYSRWPDMLPERTGWGAGQRKIEGRPNVLRAVLGKRAATDCAGDGVHVVIEANVDDMTGELAAHALSVLFAAGAIDAWATPIVMKKGRPALTLSAMAPVTNADDVRRAMLRETSSIGVRYATVGRVERPRRIMEVATRFGPIAVKVSEGPFGPPQIKPEFDACARAAAQAGVPVREVIAAAMAEAIGREPR